MSEEYVLDASAVLALLFGESGAERVEALLRGASISAANWSEVVAKLIDKGLPPGEALVDLGELDVEIVAVTRGHAELAGTLRAGTKSLGLSLGDRLSLALAIHLKATAVTSDRAWSRLEIDDLKVELIR